MNDSSAHGTAEQAVFKYVLISHGSRYQAELSPANVFLVDNDGPLKPFPRLGVFPGISRPLVIEQASDITIGVEDLEITRVNLAATEGASVCSLVMELLPISRSGARQLPVFDLLLYTKLPTVFQTLEHR